MRYRLDVVARDVSEVVRFAGGWLVDRVMAGWDVTVLISADEDTRPLEILGVETHEPGVGTRDVGRSSAPTDRRRGR